MFTLSELLEWIGRAILERAATLLSISTEERVY